MHLLTHRRRGLSWFVSSLIWDFVGELMVYPMSSQSLSVRVFQWIRMCASRFLFHFNLLFCNCHFSPKNFVAIDAFSSSADRNTIFSPPRTHQREIWIATRTSHTKERRKKNTKQKTKNEKKKRGTKSYVKIRAVSVVFNIFGKFIMIFVHIVNDNQLMERRKKMWNSTGKTLFSRSMHSSFDSSYNGFFCNLRV